MEYSTIVRHFLNFIFAKFSHKEHVYSKNKCFFMCGKIGYFAKKKNVFAHFYFILFNQQTDRPFLPQCIFLSVKVYRPNFAKTTTLD